MSPIASQTTYLVKLQDRRHVAERTMAFQFEKPEGFAFKAGQFIDMTLIKPSETDGEGNGRAFSIASAPDEGMLSGRDPDARYGFQAGASNHADRFTSQGRGTIRQPGSS